MPQNIIVVHSLPTLATLFTRPNFHPIEAAITGLFFNISTFTTLPSLLLPKLDTVHFLHVVFKSV